MASLSAKMWIVTDHVQEIVDVSSGMVDDYFETLLQKLDLKAYCGQLELSASGKYHYQYVVYLNSKQRMTYLKKALPGAHFEIVYRKKEAYMYCKKTDTRVSGPYEYGSFPFASEKKTVIDWDDVWELAKRGDTHLIESRVRIQYYSTFKRIKEDNLRPHDTVEYTRGIWIRGQPGCCKSRFVKFFSDNFRLIDGVKTCLYDKRIDKWWDKYDNSVNYNVLIDELNPNAPSSFFHSLKTWTDNRSFLADVKCGSSYPNYENLFVTSNYTLESCVLSNLSGINFIYDEQLFSALRRRFVDVNMSAVFGRHGHRCIHATIHTVFDFDKKALRALLDRPEVVHFYDIIQAYRDFYFYIKTFGTLIVVPHLFLFEIVSKTGEKFYSEIYNFEKHLKKDITDDKGFFDNEFLFGIALSDSSELVPEEDILDLSFRTRALSEISLFNQILNDGLDNVSVHSNFN